ncbi:MAG: hypothetical protein KBD53_01905 [Candidatus Omnitrophica bacterium]|nr:hypothetical protein [Candidatus Omnitrophota bacterium]
MSNNTFISEADTKKLVKICAQHVRDFLQFLDDQYQPSYFKGRDQNVLRKQEPVIFAQAKKFKLNPKAFTDHNLVQYGNNFLSAISYPVRIEVRKVKGVAGTAQIAVRGVFGEFRHTVLKQIQKNKNYDQNNFYIRLSGRTSFEINRRGVDKGLPIRYFFQQWPEVLKTIRYTPGTCIDSTKTNTLIAADGDGTTYDSPRADKVPNLNSSQAYRALLKYLESGGVYVVISGNHLDRTISRVQKFIPPNLKNRLLISANGGANLIYFGQKGIVKEISDYRTQGLSYLNSKKKLFNLDFVYIGDDGSRFGNDREAFNAAGAGRSILVDKDKTDDIIPVLKPNQIGGLTAGTKGVLEYVNQVAAKNLGQKVFTRSHIAEMVKSVRQR